MSPPLKTGNPRGACDSVLKPAGSYRRGVAVRSLARVKLPFCACFPQCRGC